MVQTENIQTRGLIRQFVGTAGVQLSGRGLAVVTGIILARVLGPDEFGLYGFIMSMIAMATIPTVAGMSQLMIREVANGHLEAKWGELKGLLRWSSIYVATLSAVVMGILSIAIYFEWIRSDIGQFLWFGLAIIPLRGLLAKQNAVLNGLRLPVLAQLTQGVIGSIVVLLALGLLLLSKTHLDAQTILILQIFASLISVLCCNYFVVKKGPKEIYSASASYKIKSWHKALIPFTLLSIVTTLNNELASVMLGFLGSKTSVGYFKVAMQGVTLLSLGLAAFNSVTGPRIARLYRKGDLAGVQSLLTRSVRLSVITSVPFALFLIFFGDFVVSLLFGDEYLPAANLLTVLCVGQIVNVVMGSVGLVLQMTGNEKKALSITLYGLFFSVLLSYLLIPIYGAKGAAYASSFSLVLINILASVQVYKSCSLKTWLR